MAQYRIGQIEDEIQHRIEMIWKMLINGEIKLVGSIIRK